MLNPSPINNPAGAPVNIAREAIKQIALRRIEPTPDNYEAIYNEIAGIKKPKPKAEKINGEAKREDAYEDAFITAFKKALRQLPNQTTDQHNWIHRWEKVITKADWDKLPDILSEGMGASISHSTQWPDVIRTLLLGWETRYIRLTLAQKKEMLERVLINYGGEQDLPNKLSAMVDAWEQFTINQSGNELISAEASALVEDSMPEHSDSEQSNSEESKPAKSTALMTETPAEMAALPPL